MICKLRDEISYHLPAGSAIMSTTAKIRKNAKTFTRTPIILIEWIVIGLFLISLTPTRGLTANFNIVPTSLELGGNAKSGAFSVMNGSSEKLNCQIEVKEWTQDANGKDVYADTGDIVFFPKIMTVQPKEQRAIRIGIKGPLPPQERTYRLFVEEIPVQKSVAEANAPRELVAGLTIAFRYSMPIFVKPVIQRQSGVIEKTNMVKGAAKVVVRNTGNVHLKLSIVAFRGKSADGKEVFSKEAAGWYILHGQSRSFEVTVPQELCLKLATIVIDAQSENFTINGTLAVHKEMCTQ
jgi:fimbrial chaperone protein